MRDREKIKKLFVAGDQYIENHPEVVKMTTDEIFHSLNDGTEEMIHLRWAVMVRVSMKQLNKFDYDTVVEYLVTISEKNLMCEYIGYILQEEQGISLLKLMQVAYVKGVAQITYPYVVVNIPYEKNCDMDEFDNIMNILEAEQDNRQTEQILNNYAVLLIKEEKEEDVLEKYCQLENELFERLMHYISAELFATRQQKAVDFIKILLEQKKNWCNRAAVDFVVQSTMYNCNGFDAYFRDIERLADDDKKYWLRLIPAYVNYLECDGGILRNEVYERLLSIISSDIEAKKYFVRTIAYKKLQSKECKQLIEEFLKVSFEKDTQILDGLELILSDKVEEDYDKGLEILQSIFSVNGYRISDKFLESLPQVCHELAKNQEAICETVFDRILNGQHKDFAFAIQLFVNVLDVARTDEFFQKNVFTEQQKITILRGVLYFTIEVKKVCSLVFYMSRGTKITQEYLNVCKKDFYENYPGTLVETAQRFSKSNDENQSKLSSEILIHNEQHLTSIKEVYIDKDLRPSAERQLTYQKAKQEESKRISREAGKHSIFMQFCANRQMKYGKRYALVLEVGKNQYSYQVNSYTEHKFEWELPKRFMNNPLELTYLREEYLKSRSQECD